MFFFFAKKDCFFTIFYTEKYKIEEINEDNVAEKFAAFWWKIILEEHCIGWVIENNIVNLKSQILFTQCSFVFFSVKYSQQSLFGEKNTLFLQKNSKNKIEKKIKNKKNVKNNVKPLPKKNPYGEKKTLMGELDLTN